MNATWHCIRLSREDYDAGESAVLQGVFYASFVAKNGPRGAALYGAWDHDGRAVTLYFTPESWECARVLFLAYSAKPCASPRTDRLEWICGDTSRSTDR